jgi:ribosomal protein S14
MNNGTAILAAFATPPQEKKKNYNITSCSDCGTKIGPGRAGRKCKLCRSSTAPAVTRWLEALRSGKYEQGKEHLHQIGDSTQFCCLGVACAVSDLVTASEITSTSIIGSIRCMKYGSDPNEPNTHAYPPNIIKDELGLVSREGDFIANAETRAIFDSGASKCSLVHLNDSGATFEQIAQIIELRPQGLFVDDR